MKFSEMPYQRPNLDEIKAQFAAVTQRFAAAPDYAAAKAAFLDEQTLNKHVDTLANLASIRNTIDTRDEFYDDEMNFWNAATPADPGVPEYLERRPAGVPPTANSWARNTAS